MSTDEVLLIGDTPADVHAALAIGVPLLAVASGRSVEEDLRNAGAACILPDLTDVSAVLAHFSWNG
ncbi:HAD hydrolase-like protein [Actinacidiphila glaucinigra]|uniref:HAD family hydrolase n=1 Tax=Actinacidiphila glaucinigra TaxID=235986 RepID=UPI0032501640